MGDKQFLLETDQWVTAVIKKDRTSGFLFNKEWVVYLGYIHDRLHLAFPERLKSIKYESVDALLADGWKVD